MKISVVIPACNGADTLRETLDSVLCQTVQADEILVLDDGSTDETPAILNTYRSRITVISQKNQGVGRARNSLCQKAQGDLIAFLDSDDIWHPRYLEVQRRLFLEHPECVAFFVGHVNFSGRFSHKWEYEAAQCAPEIIDPVNFLRRINSASAPFGMSYCCIPKVVLTKMGPEPFRLRLAEDFYFHCCRAPLGKVLYLPAVLATYRVHGGSLSSNTLNLSEAMTKALESLEDSYDRQASPELRTTFSEALALKRRHYAKLLLGAGDFEKARKQLIRSAACCSKPVSVAKSLALLILSCMPSPLQPRWPTASRR